MLAGRKYAHSFVWILYFAGVLCIKYARCLPSDSIINLSAVMSDKAVGKRTDLRIGNCENCRISKRLTVKAFRSKKSTWNFFERVLFFRI